MKKGMRRGRTVALLATTMLVSVAGTSMGWRPAEAQEAAQVYNFNIPPKPIRAAMNDIVRVSGIDVVFAETPAASATGNAVHGSLTPAQAVANLLTGSGLSFAFTDRNTVTIFDPSQHYGEVGPDGAIVLGTITLHGPGDLTEGTGSYTTSQMGSAIGLPLSIKETPQSVSVVTRKAIDDQKYETLDRALTGTPGIVVHQDSGDNRWVYAARGSTIDNIRYDGLATTVLTFTRDVVPDDDLTIYDRVEIVRGATGLLTGAGNPSATINLVRKKPTADHQTSITTTASSWGNLRTTLDTSGGLNADGSLRGRFVGSGFLGDNQRDTSESKTGTLYGVLEYDLTDATTASVGVLYQKHNTDGYMWSGVPTKLDGSFYNFDHDTFLGSDWYYANKQQTVVDADIDHEFNNGWKLSARGRYARASTAFLSGATYYDGSDLFREDYNVEYDNESYSLGIDLNGPVELFGREHDVILGASTNREHLWTRGGVQWGIPISDPENWDSGSLAEPDLGLDDYSRSFTIRQTGIYGAVRLNIMDNLKFITGGRFAWYEDDTVYTGSWGSSPSHFEANGEFTPYVGVVYDINDTYSAYASYTTIFQPQSAYGRDGSLLDPIEGTNVEAGMKAAFLDGGLNASVAVFETNRKNLAELTSDTANCSIADTSCYDPAGRVRTRGFEMELSGQVRPDWNVMASYTYAISEYAEGENKGRKFGTNTYPEHSFKLATTYQLPGQWEKLTIGGALRAQSKTYYSSDNFLQLQPSYVVADVMAKYDFSSSTSLQLNINNLFDETYYTRLSGSAHSSNFIGAGRNVTLTLTSKF